MQPGWKEKLLKGVLWFSGLFHIIGGGMIALSSQAAADYGDIVFGMTVTVNPEMAYILKTTGLYALAFGALIIAAARNPMKYRFVILVTLGIYLFRFFNRLSSIEEIQQTFNVSADRAWLAVFVLGLISLLMTISIPWKSDGSKD